MKTLNTSPKLGTMLLSLSLLIAGSATAAAPIPAVPAEPEVVYLCTGADGSTELSNEATGPECEQLLAGEVSTDATAKPAKATPRGLALDSDTQSRPPAEPQTASSDNADSDGRRKAAAETSSDSKFGLGEAPAVMTSSYNYVYSGGTASPVVSAAGVPAGQAVPSLPPGVPVPTVEGHAPTGVTTPTVATTTAADQSLIDYRSLMMQARTSGSGPAYLQNPAIYRRYLATTRAAYGR
jgi:hypothetical protein